LRRADFDKGVTQVGRQCRFALPLFKFVKFVIEDKELLHKNFFKRMFSILKVYVSTKNACGQIGVWPRPYYDLHEAKLLRRELGRKALQLIKDTYCQQIANFGFGSISAPLTHPMHAFTECRPSTTPGVPHYSFCYDEMLRTWDMKQARKYKKEKGYKMDLSIRFERGEFGKVPEKE
jgi:hypothetical protein